MARRAPAPKADRERARQAGEYVRQLGLMTEDAYERAYSLQTREGWRRYMEALREEHGAAEVAADAFEEVHQDRQARSYRARAKRILSMMGFATGAPRRDPPGPRLRRISDRPRSSEGNENLAYLLDREVRAIGPESAAAPPAKNIRLLISNERPVYGRGGAASEALVSYRYVGLEDGRPVSALQIVSADGIRGTIANVYTTPIARRRGWARRLLEAARRRFREVKHSSDLSPAGEAWKNVVRDPESARRQRALSLHEDASRANRRLNAERYRYLDKPLTKNPSRWHARVATLARETSDLWAVTADAYEEAGDADMGELARRKSHDINVIAIDYAAGIARDADYRGQKVPFDFARAAFDARRDRPGALEVLRDGIEEWFPKQYASAVKDAEHHWSETRMPWVVLFNARAARARFRSWQDARSVMRSPFDIQTAASIARNGMPPYSAIIWPSEMTGKMARWTKTRSC